MCGSAYPLRGHLQNRFHGARLNAQQKEFNTAMSSVRTPAERLFGDILNHFKFILKSENRSMSFWQNVRSLHYFAESKNKTFIKKLHFNT